MRLVVVLDCLQPSPRFWITALAYRLAPWRPSVVLVPDAGRADLVGQRVPEPRRARTAYT